MTDGPLPAEVLKMDLGEFSKQLDRLMPDFKRLQEFADLVGPIGMPDYPWLSIHFRIAIGEWVDFRAELAKLIALRRQTVPVTEVDNIIYGIDFKRSLPPSA